MSDKGDVAPKGVPRSREGLGWPGRWDLEEALDGQEVSVGATGSKTSRRWAKLGQEGGSLPSWHVTPSARCPIGVTSPHVNRRNSVEH